MNRTALAAGLVAWLNLYLVRHAFFTHFSGYANAMHGYWIALAAVPYRDWLLPSWWPWWDGGMPLEHTYAPLVPWLLRVLSALGLNVFHAWHVLAGFVFVLVPVALVIHLRRLDVSWPVAALAGAMFSLFAPSETLAPETVWGQVTRPQRLDLVFVWDDVPHLLAIGLFLLGWRPLAMLANAFGLVLVALETLFEPHRWKWALGGFVLVLPWWPPSLLLAIRRNAEGGFSWLALLVTLAPALWIARRSRWGALTWVFAATLLCERLAGLHCLPQPMRYVLEFNVALTIFLATLLDRCPRRAQAVLALVLIGLGARQVIDHRRFAKSVIREVAMEKTFEYQLARELAARRVEEPVFLPGSAAAWANAFVPVRQFGGGSFSTALNPAQQRALDVIQGRVPGEDPVAWLERFGVKTVVVSLKEGREFWKPFADPGLYEGRLPLIWRDADVAVYRVPVAAARQNWHPAMGGGPDANGLTDPGRKYEGGAEAWATRAASLLALLWFYRNSAINSSRADEPGQSFS